MGDNSIEIEWRKIGIYKGWGIWAALETYHEDFTANQQVILVVSFRHEHNKHSLRFMRIGENIMPGLNEADALINATKDIDSWEKMQTERGLFT